MISEARQGQILLHQARGHLAAVLQPEDPAPREPLQLTAEETRWLAEPGATFVTLTEEGQLRGCIGSVEAFLPLEEDLAKNVRSAALEDPRFLPATAADYHRLRMEVSLLSPLEPLPSCADQAAAEALLRPGVDGVLLECHYHRSTFLPQVWETFANPRDFLHHLKKKAGLDPFSWPADLRLWRYAVQKWREGASEL